MTLLVIIQVTLVVNPNKRTGERLQIQNCMISLLIHKRELLFNNSSAKKAQEIKSR